jgi:hypothetical protein
MTLEANPAKIVWASGMDELQPFPRAAGDGTYEVVIPLAGSLPPVILPYSFFSEEDATLWIHSPKGSNRILKARTHFE